MKKLLILVLLLFCLSFAFADTITAYSVPTSIPLNQKITATGLYDSNSTKNQVLCSFYFFDEASKLVHRASDQYTIATGRFSMVGTTLSEPTFVRGQTYNLRTECGGATADANFSVGQKQEAFNILGYKFYPQGVTMDFLYFKDNGVMIFFLFIMIFVLIALGIVIFQNFYG
jgi:hypothetical protein